MKKIEEFKFLEDVELTEWKLLQEKTRLEFESLLGIKSADEVTLITGISGQLDEIWEWREYFKEVKEITDKVNYKEEEKDEEGNIVAVDWDFGYVAIVEFIFNDKTHVGILFQDLAPAGIFIRKFDKVK